jgi:hypothetical protein
VKPAEKKLTIVNIVGAATGGWSVGTLASTSDVDLSGGTRVAIWILGLILLNGALAALRTAIRDEHEERLRHGRREDILQALRRRVREEGGDVQQVLGGRR